jgi:hypothetical protein
MRKIWLSSDLCVIPKKINGTTARTPVVIRRHKSVMKTQFEKWAGDILPGTTLVEL